MRQRVVKGKEGIMLLCQNWIVREPQTRKGSWAESFKRRGDIFLELGSGKGQFITRLAAEEPAHNFIAAEGGENIVIRTLEKAQAASLENLLVIPEYITDPELVFEEDELSGIYVNFCDPWPKERHARRRLIHRELLRKYQHITKAGSMLAFKTDNEALFQFSLEQFRATELDIVEFSMDLHHSKYASGNISTEYEDKFAAMGKPIFYALVSLGDNKKG